MFNSIIKNYFTDKNYNFLYLHNTFKTVSFLTMGLFISGWLYKLGVGVHWIILYHAMNFTLMGLISPIGAYLANRFGLVPTFGLSFLAYFTSLVCLSFAEGHYQFILLGLAFSAIANGFQNPPDIILHAAYVQNKNRGRAFSIVNIITTIMTFLSVLLSGWMVENFGFWGLSLVCGIFWSLSLFCLTQMHDRLKNSEQLRVKKIYADVFTKQNRVYLGIALGFQFIIIGSFVFVPILLYLATENFQSISIIAAVAVIIQSVVVVLQGIWVDKTKGNAPLRFALLTHGAGMLIYSLPFLTKSSLFIGDTFQRTGLMLFFGSLFPRVHNNIVDKKIPLLSFGAVFHMAICFWEFIVLNIMAMMVYIFGAQALTYCLITCAVGGFISYFYCHKMMEEKT